MTVAQFEIRIDGTPRTYRDWKDYAMEAARLIKSKNPDSMVEVKDLKSGEVTTVALRPVRAIRGPEAARPFSVLHPRGSPHLKTSSTGALGRHSYSLSLRSHLSSPLHIR